VGEVVPATETCATPEDDDCDGLVNEDGDGCACEPGVDTMVCYGGPDGTAGVGICTVGQQTCNAAGTGYDATCTGETLPGTEACDQPQDEDCDGFACAEAKWARAIPGITGISDDPMGNVFVVGTFSAAIDFGGTTLIPSGTDGFVAKYSPTGTLLWAKQYEAQIRDVVGLDDGSVLVCGVYGNADFGCGALPPDLNSNAVVARLDAAGGCTYSEGYGSTGGQVFVSMAVDQAAGVVRLLGQNSGQITFGSTYTATGIDTFVLTAGLTDGQATSLQHFTVNGDQIPKTIAVDPSGNYSLIASSNQASYVVYPTGATLTGPGSFVVHAGANGAPLWSKGLTQNVTGLAVSPTGETYVTGTTGGGNQTIAGVPLSPTGLTATFLVRYSLLGGAEATAVESDYYLGFPSIAFGRNGRLFFGASLAGTVDFGSGPLTSGSGPDPMDFDGVLAGVTPMPIGPTPLGWSAVWSRLQSATGSQAAAVFPSRNGGLLVRLATGGSTVDLGGGVTLSGDGVVVYGQ